MAVALVTRERAGYGARTHKAPPSPLSAGRAALADHLDRLADAQSEAERLLKPVARLRATVEAAEIQFRSAEADAGAAREADALQKWAAAGDGSRPMPTLLSRERAEAAAKIGNAAGALEAARAALAAATEPLTKAQLRVSQLSARTAGLVLAVIQEEADAALDCLRQARQSAACAEATVGA